MFYVYEDWTTEELSRCFYVGKGDASRVARLKRTNKRHRAIHQELGLKRVVVFENSDESIVLDYERIVIKERHTHVHDSEYNGIGCNLTLGGQGKSGRVVSRETGRKISEAKKGKTPNRTWTDEERETMSKRMSLLHKGKIIPLDVRQKISKTINDPVVKCKMITNVTNALNKKYEDPMYRQRVKDSHPKGERCSSSKFTEQVVRQIRKEWKAEGLGSPGNRWGSPRLEFCQRWANIVGSTPVSVCNIAMFKTWKHIPDDDDT